MSGPMLDRQRRHESPELEAMLGRMMNALIRRCAEGDTEAVEALARLEALARQANTSGLFEARRAGGYSLADLAKVTGTTRQAVSQRTAGPVVLATAARPDGHLCDHHGCVGMRRCRISVSRTDVPPTDSHTEHNTTERNPS